MSLNPEWNITCRICLQEGETRSLFELCPESNLSYCAKVMQCTSVEIRLNDSLPEQICAPCIRDLNVAYRFRVNCESSDAILQSYREASGTKGDEVDDGDEQDVDMAEVSSYTSEIQIPIGSDVLYSYKPPSGLNVKLVSREQTLLLENNGEIIICGRPPPELMPELAVDDRDDIASTGESLEAPEPPDDDDDDDDSDSLITYDDALPLSTSRTGNVEEELDEGTEARSELINGVVGEEDNRTADSGKQPDDSSVDLFFDAELVYVDKEDDLLDQLASIKREDDVDDWEIIYDDESSNDYFKKIPQVRAARAFEESTANKVESAVEQQSSVCFTGSPMKTIKTIRKANVPNEEKPTIENIITKPGPDGLMETVIRVKRNLKTVKQRHVCKLCNRSYKYKHALETHLRRHRGDKPYKCTDCEKAFVVPFELRRHMRTHTGAKPYKCKYCERQFSDFGSKIKHERTHTGERPYVCEICEKSFTYSHVLNSHMLIHTGVKKYSCPDCGKRFAKSHHLKAHMNTHVRSTSNNNNNNNSINKSNFRKENSIDSIGIGNPISTIISDADGDADDDDDDDNGDAARALAQFDRHHQSSSLMASGIDDRSTDFQLDEGNPFGQLVNISDYMISTKSGDTASIGAIMAADCGSADEDGVGDDEDALLNVVTVLASSNQVSGLVDGDYGNIRIINGSISNGSKMHAAATRILPNSRYLMRAC
ncbi:uncharacterized protein LOC131685496 [Topomyia yanbarensis]|uniref:uncharacterized protein LOC131685496 n=1 Tax=Topomyia yanbarensis TaxID=2498891 RepID=UPI00273B47E2|nr:uncharacterized protein LOC131685496 [Topomyia yanbarensis]